MRKLLLAVAIGLAAACGGSDTPNPGPGSSGESEPNDSSATATPIPLGAHVVAALGTSTDLDYYSIIIPTGGQTIRIQTFDSTGTGCATIDPSVTVYNASLLTVVADSQSSGLGLCSDTTATLAAGTYYILVRTTAGFAFAYDLVVSTLSPTATNESEPNDDGTPSSSLDFSPANADGPFTGPVMITGAITPTGDDDFFVFTNPYGHAATLHLETFLTWNGTVGACSGIDTEIDVYDSTYVWRANDDDSGISLCSYLNYDLAAGQTVYVRVTSFMDTGTIASYRLLMDI